ncbi:hypothetical protein Leryth_008232 [Lithospermum erythrorhizon]|uniref:Protein kinase domain-containing protein n=1 Tax=Lithospermum erythrorhizon TaxID=34254 RepID=A0AAV3QLI0_LITER|nr:hypothetical protein Leryth_008232 [Lithospermum erythrorhizon]
MEWIRGDKIGHGSFVTVNLAIPRNKICSKLMAVKSGGATHSASLMNEKLILDELQECPHIISCFGDCFTFENGEKLYNVLLDYASGGSLGDKLKNSNDHRLSEIDVRRYTKSILKGLEFMHKKGYVHCDIKLDNILLDQHGFVKIADFGLAKKSEESSDGNPGCELRGTPMYMSPEMATGGEQEFPADIWALGCAMAEMVTGSSVWQCSDIARLLMKIGVGEERPEIPGNLSDEGKDFLEKCFVKDPSKRWTAEMLLNHPFVDQDYEDIVNNVTLYNKVDLSWNSPKCQFDFPDWVNEHSSSMACSNSFSPFSSSDLDTDCHGGSRGSSSNSAAKRLSKLVCDQMPDWSIEDDWITVR